MALSTSPLSDYGRIIAGIDVSYFFDRPKVLAAVDRATVRSLARCGKIVRDKTKSGIKKRGGARTRQLTSQRGQARQQQEARARPPSQPGTPPHTHTGFFRKWIAYAYDPMFKSVVIGSLRSHWLYDLHEFGGTNPRLRRPANYPARPAFGEGLKKALPYLPKQFENMIRVYS